MYTNVHQQNNSPTPSNRSYGFKELAILYFPNIAPSSASIRLKQWIKDDIELLNLLEETNYHLLRLPFLSRSAAAPTATARTLFGRGTPCGKGRDHPSRQAFPPKGDGRGAEREYTTKKTST